MIDMLVVPPVFARPHQNGILESRRAENQCEEPHRPRSLESDMRKEPMVPEANAEAACEKHCDEERDLKPVESEKPEIGRHCRECERERAHEK